MPTQKREQLPNHRLRKAREARNWTQLEVADALGTTKLVVGRWERGERTPRRYYWKKLCELFGKNAVELGLLPALTEEPSPPDTPVVAASPYWNVPYRCNPFFTGRDDVLQQLHAAISQDHTALIGQSYALSGLGGIGKTQTAIEYAYRYKRDYTAIFWVNSETSESIISSIVAIAALLNLPEERNQEQAVAAVLLWLTNHHGWLLIFDNVEDPAQVKRFLPSTRNGSLLFTSRQQSLGLEARKLNLEPMTLEEGAHFLLRRARWSGTTTSLEHLSPAEETIVHKIVAAMDGLPLALDQAAAYIEATQCSLSDYLQLLRVSTLRLLDERESHADHPLSVTRTFSLVSEQLEKSNSAAAELLTACAFLSPEAIPEAFFLEGARHLGPTFERLAADPLQLHSAIKALLSFSLIQRNTTTRTLTIHRLVQAILKGSLSEEDQRNTTTRIINTMSRLFPSNKSQVDYWRLCDSLLPHALVCLELGEQWNTDVTERVTLMCYVVNYLANRAQFARAEELCQHALQLGEHVLGTEHSLVAQALKALATIFFQQGKYEETKLCCQRALKIEEQVLGPEDPQLAGSLNNLAILYMEQGEREEAEPLFRRALSIWERALGPKHPRVTTALHNLGAFYMEQGKYEEAEPLFQRTLHDEEQMLGPEDPDIAFPLTNLGSLYHELGKYAEAKIFYQRAFRIREQTLGKEHHLVAEPLIGLAIVCREQGEYQEAEILFQNALHIWEQTQGLEHPLVAQALVGLAALYQKQEKYQEAELLYQRALTIRELAWGSEHSLLAEPFQGLAQILADQGKYEQANPLYQRALMLRRERLGPYHPYVGESLLALARFHQVQQQTTEALLLYQQALAIRERAFGPDHSKTREIQIEYTRLNNSSGAMPHEKSIP